MPLLSVIICIIKYTSIICIHKDVAQTWICLCLGLTTSCFGLNQEFKIDCEVLVITP